MTEVKEVPWLRTAEGYVRLPVLRQFSFIYPVTEHRGGAGVMLQTGQERKFPPGEHFLNPNNPLDLAVLEHPWIWRDFADGYIENPVKTKERVDAEMAKSAQIRAHQEALQREAATAFERAQIAAENTGATGVDVEDDLNRPLNQPRGKGKRQIRADVPVSDALQKELNTPISQLPRV